MLRQPNIIGPGSGGRSSAAQRLRAVLLCLTTLLIAAFGQDAPTSAPLAAIPSARQADRIAVLTIEGEIDGWTAVSIERRLAEAEASGVGGVVIELNTPGGEVTAVLRITAALKQTAITNTVAWVHPDAYSGGAIIALACREIVASSNASMGDAFAVTPDFANGVIRTLTPAERTKLLPVMMSDVTDSARRSGFDEFIAQAILIDGIELWLVEDSQTGRRHAVNESEYRLLFDGDPPRGKPMLAGVTGARYRATTDGPEQAIDGPISEPDPTLGQPAPAAPDPATPDSAAGDEQPDAESSPSNPAADDPAPVPGTEEDQLGFRPASPELDDVARAFNDQARRDSLAIDTPSDRPYFSMGDRGRYTLVAYLTDGSAPAVMKSDQLATLGFSAREINTDGELLNFFGATSLERQGMSWSEGLARFLSSMWVRGFLIIVLLLGLFLEMVSPGLVAPGACALIALGALLAPPMIVGMAGWWEILAIVGGIAFIAIELLALPGFGFFGVLGLVGLFVGLVGTFIPDGPTYGTSNGNRMVLGAATVLLSSLTALIGMYFISRHIGSIPLLSRLVLTSSHSDDDEQRPATLLELMAKDATDRPDVGAVGVASTALRPSGRAEFDDRIIDVVSALDLIEPGTPVRVVEVTRFRVVVEAADNPDPQDSTEGSA